MKKVFNNQNAFTLVEVIIYLTLASIIIIAVVSISVQMLKYKTEAERVSVTYQEVQRAFEKIIYEVRRGDGYNVISTTEADLITDGETVKVYLSNDQIYVVENGETSALTTDIIKITKLEFTDWTSPNASNILHITIETEKYGKVEKFQTSVHARSPY